MQGRVFLGRYETIRLLGEGGMGRVYLAKQLDLGRQVVVKVMHDHIAADPTFRERFSRETLLMARFQHPYAVTLYDASLNDPQGSCIIMEYIKGVTLDTLLQKHKRLDPPRVGKLLHQTCEVLQAAHAEGIIHRDLKPANLMVVDPDTQYEMVKVMDFGLAKLLGPEAGIGVTNHEFAVGTPGYMCPEQARGEDMDHRGDLYSIGVILFELLTGRLPFAGRETMDVLLAHATEAAPSFATVGASGVISPALERVIQACLAKSPDDRPGHARQLAEMYTEALAASQRPAAAPAAAPALPGSARLRPRPAGRVNVPAQPAGGIALAPLPAPPPPSLPPEPVVVKSPPPAPVVTDPLAVVHHLEAWLPETIATWKLRGFLHEAGGELVESVPGRICVRLGGDKECRYKLPARGLSFFGLGRRASIDVELRLLRPDPTRENHLKVTVVFRSPGLDLNADAAWRSLCDQVLCDLRAHLIAKNGPSG